MSANEKVRNVQGDSFQNTISPKSTEQAMLLKQDAIIAALNTVQDAGVIDSDAGAGGLATEAMVVTGLLATDEITVEQMTPGANSLALIGWSTQADDTVTGIWAADPGAGAVLRVSYRRAKSVSGTELASVVLKGG